MRGVKRQDSVPMKQSRDFFATCAENLSDLLAEELVGLGARVIKATVAGVAFTGTLELAYRVCLWSRLANRVLLQLQVVNGEDAGAIYAGVQKIDWLKHLRPHGSLKVDFWGTSDGINNSHFGALKVKDAIVDQVRNRTGVRPDVERDQPDLTVNVHLKHGTATIGIDLSGRSLHRRSYRMIPGAAPLKETLAAALLYRGGWPALAKQGGVLIDPMCGSGTILIEAAMMAQDYAPGLLGKFWGFENWLGHDAAGWQRLLDEAVERRRVGRANFAGAIYGSDLDPRSVQDTQNHLAQADLSEDVKVRQAAVRDLIPPLEITAARGMIMTNPPYGQRLQGDLVELYQDFGERLRNYFQGWSLLLFAGNLDLARELGIRAQKGYTFTNGTLPCKLLKFSIIPQRFWHQYREGYQQAEES